MSSSLPDQSRNWGIDGSEFPLPFNKFTHGEWDKIWPANVVLIFQLDPQREDVAAIGNFETVATMPIPFLGKALLAGDSDV